MFWTPLERFADTDELSEEDAEERDAQRYIFCSRAYMFDSVEPLTARRGGSARTRPTAPPPSPLPSAMPARFRHAAQQVPQLTDGTGNATPPADGFRGPTVQFLLPSAALHGIVGAEANHGLDAPPRAEDLMQVTCQVTNVSRVG